MSRKYKDYEAIYKIFSGTQGEDGLKAIAQAYSGEERSECTAVDVVIAMAKSDGLTDDEICDQIIYAAWYSHDAANRSGQYWDCDCDDFYIHSNEVSKCLMCCAERDRSPASNQASVDEGSQFAWLAPGA